MNNQDGGRATGPTAIPAEIQPPGMLEHPQHPGLFYDPSIVYIRTGDAAKDAAHRLMMFEHTYCIPQTFIIGSTKEGNA